MSGSVAVGIPVCGQPTWSLLMSLLGLKSPGDWTFLRGGQATRPLPIADSHNELVEKMLAMPDCQWLMIVGQDAVLHPDTLLRLMSWKVPVVAALAFTRTPPVSPVAYSGQTEDTPPNHYHTLIDETRDWLRWHRQLWTHNPVVIEPRPHDALVKLEGFAGDHAMLIRRAVFETIGPPWFKHVAGPDSPGTGCDRYFCEKAREAGFGVYMDRSVVAGHQYGDRSLGALDFLAWDSIADWNGHRWVVPLASVHAEREWTLREFAPELFTKPGTLLYIGASIARAHFVQELFMAHQRLTLLEVWPANVEHFAKDRRFERVVKGDVRNLDDSIGVHDISFWCHGPEHIPIEELAQTLQRVEARTRSLVVLGCPWGRFDYAGHVGGNPHDEHQSAVYPRDLEALGYDVITLGRPDEAEQGYLFARKEI